MSRITGVALLLIILTDNFYESKASHTKHNVSKEHIRKCGCRVFPNGKIWCRSPLFPAKYVQIQDLVKCFCSKKNHGKFPEFRAACISSFLSTPL